MAHTLSLSNGSTTISLAVASGNGIYLEQFVPPAGDRKATRVGPAPIGQRTIVSRLPDSEATIRCCIISTSTDAVEALYLSLMRLLELARAWEEGQTGAPVRLAWKRQGATNTAYWTVTGVPEIPRPVGAAEWLDEEAAANQLTIQMTLTLEPVAHAGALTAIKTSTAIAMVAGSNTITTSAPTGDIEGPCNVLIAKDSVGNDWTQAWIAQIIGTPDVTDYSGTAVAGTYGGQYEQKVAGVGALLAFTGAGGYVINTSHQYPIRGFLRMMVTVAPTAGIGAVQVRMRINLGTATGTPLTLPWVNFAGTLNNWFLVDLGAVPTLSNLQGRINQTTANYFVTIEMQSSDGTTFTARCDYSEFFAYFGFVKLTGIDMAFTNDLVYEDTSTIYTGAVFTAPRQNPQAYETDTLGGLTANAARFGKLARVPPGTAVKFWFQAQSATLHQIADTALARVDHLPMYAAGLRGAG